MDDARKLVFDISRYDCYLESSQDVSEDVVMSSFVGYFRRELVIDVRHYQQIGLVKDGQRHINTKKYIISKSIIYSSNALDHVLTNNYRIIIHKQFKSFYIVYFNGKN